jgi:ribosome-associated protein
MKRPAPPSKENDPIIAKVTTLRASNGETTHLNAASLESAVRAAQACDSMRGRDTIVLDLRNVTPLFDFFVISTGTNARQTVAMADEVHRTLRSHGAERMGLEGQESGSWVVEDYGDVVVHVFAPEERKHYDLERLWGDAPKVDWKELSTQLATEVVSS